MTLKEFYKLNDKKIDAAIASALNEDVISNDISSNFLLNEQAGSRRINAILLCKQDCILSGLEIFKKVYRQIDKSIVFKSFYKDGSRIKKGSEVMYIKTALKNLLKGERTALNFLQRMSGIATLTSRFVQKLKNKNSRILHTRKTTPNFRLFEAAAVKTGGGDFHRLSLGSSILIKDNHIVAAGGISRVLERLHNIKISNKLKQKLEIEVKSFNELNTVVEYGKGIIKIVMLDNFNSAGIEKASRLLKKNGFKIEVSGGLNLQNFDKYQKKAVDFYSIGGLTHSYNSVDFSLEF